MAREGSLSLGGGVMPRDQYTAAIEAVERMQKIIEGPEPDWSEVHAAVIAGDVLIDRAALEHALTQG